MEMKRSNDYYYLRTIPNKDFTIVFALMELGLSTAPEGNIPSTL